MENSRFMPKVEIFVHLVIKLEEILITRHNMQIKHFSLSSFVTIYNA